MSLENVRATFMNRRGFSLPEKDPEPSAIRSAEVLLSPLDRAKRYLHRRIIQNYF